MNSVFLFLAAVCAFLGVAMGAFGAHGLKSVLSADMMAVYRTAVDYQMWHALGLGLVAMVRQQMPEVNLLRWSGWLMFAGIVLFSGSLYLLAILNLRWLGMVTPLGGLAFLAAWACLAIVAFKSK